MRDGITLGALLIFGLIHPTIGLPLTLGYLIFATPHAPALSRRDVIIFLLVAIKAAWMGMIYFVYKDAPLLSFARLVSVDLVFLTTMMVRKREPFFHGLGVPIFALFLVDVLFNAWTVILGADPLGRVATSRPDDYLPRLGGVFFHPFYSINISIVAMLFALYLKKRWLFMLGMLNILFNGSYRGVVTLAVFWMAYLLIKRRTRFAVLLISSLAMAASVFGATYYSISLYEGPSANYFRVFAWLNALDAISRSPIIGHHTFAAGPLPNVSEETIAEYGIAESAYLDYALRYGVVPALIHFAILLSVFSRSVRAVYSPQSGSSKRFKFTAAIFALVAFTDSFYGTFIGSALTSVSFGLFVFAGRHRSIAHPPFGVLQQRS